MELNINIDHIATLRNARGVAEPSVTEGAKLAMEAGAEGIVCHLREDRRHIRDRDVFELREIVHSKLDLEMADVPEIVEIALAVRPELVTIVPEKRQELTTEGGLDVIRYSSSLSELVKKMQGAGIETSLFIEPSTEQIEKSAQIGADMVEIHTGHYALHTDPQLMAADAAKIAAAASYAKSLGLKVAAGHGLNYANTALIAAIKEIDELSIGHSVISRAVFSGIYGAVKEMKSIMAAAQ